MKMVPITTDDTLGFRLDERGPPPAAPVASQETRSIRCRLQHDPVTAVRLRIQPNWRDPMHDATCGMTPARWRIDEVTVDDAPVTVDVVDNTNGTVRLLNQGAGATGRVLFVRFTNVGEEPAHFYAVWELEDPR
jgi:hypothetical protein